MKAKTMTPEIRPLNRDDLYAVFGNQTPPCDVFGMVMVHNGEILAMGGIVDYLVPLGFGNLSDKGRQYPVLLIKMVNEMRDLLDAFDQPIIAIVDDNEPSAERFIQYCGFKHVDGRAYTYGHD
jgi:hypothetical protein